MEDKNIGKKIKHAQHMILMLKTQGEFEKADTIESLLNYIDFLERSQIRMVRSMIMYRRIAKHCFKQRK